MIFRFGLFLLIPTLALGQANVGELRITVHDATGLPVPGHAELVSQSNQYARQFDAGPDGQIVVKRLPFGRYTASFSYPGFAPATQMLDVYSAMPISFVVTLGLGEMKTTVNVTGGGTLIDPADVSSANRVGNTTLENRLSAQPGRSLGDLVNQQPGWILEANGVLHPRGEEYQTQYVVDGLPLTENRSVAFVPDFEADDVQEMTVYTAGFPAEYGRKLGGVIEVETRRDSRQGLHGSAALSGGSFTTAGAFASGQYVWDRSTFALSASSTTTDRYLDPPVLQNYTNHGTLADFMAHYERDLTPSDRFGIILRREQSRFLVPDEIMQQAAGQRQDRTNFETAAQFSYQHIFSPNVLADFRGMVRDITAGFWSNDLSTPMIAGQDRGYHEAYAKATVSVHAGSHEFKTGAELDYASLQEALNYRITNPALFAPDIPPAFVFYGHAPDREQAAFAQDQFRWKTVTLSAGVRFDHYDLLVNRSGWSPRLGIAVYWPWTKIVFRGAYDRVFQTPPFENLLVSSSPLIASLSDQVLRLPVQPARGSYYQAGFARAFFGKLRFNSNFFWRGYLNYPDDDLLLNTGVGFPITFARADIYGVETKLDLPRWGPFSGSASWTNMRGKGYFPVTGGLFLGDEAAQAISATSGVFPVSQDQRNTARARFRYEITPRIWAAIGVTYDTGVPIDFNGTLQQAELEYGPAILQRVNFIKYRPRPQSSLNASLGILLRKSEQHPVRFQIDGVNLTDEINVIDFAGLFSGTAIGVTRSVNAHLQFQF